MHRTATDLVRSLVERLTAHHDQGPRALHLHPPQSQDFIQRLLQILPGMAYRSRADAARTMEFVSPGCRALTGFEPQDLVSNRSVSYAQVIHPEDRRRVWESVQGAMLTAGTFDVTYRICRLDGQESAVYERGAAVVGARGELTAIVGYVTPDVGRLVDDRPVTSPGPEDPTGGEGAADADAPAEALGSAAVGLAHDLNNSLTIIKTTAEILLAEHRGNAALVADLAEIVSAVNHGSALSRRLSLLGRSEGPRPDGSS